MSHSNCIRFLAAPALLALSVLACGLPGQVATVGQVIVGPDPAATVSQDDLKKAADIIRKRLDQQGLDHGITVSTGRITIPLASLDDADTVTALATQPGVLEIFPADTAPAEGSAVPADHAAAILTDQDVASAAAKASQNGGAQWQVGFTLRSGAAKTFEAFTAAHIGTTLVIARDGVVLSSPRVMSAISGGQGEIVARFDQAEAQLFAAELTSGRLPIALKLLEVSLGTPSP